MTPEEIRSLPFFWSCRRRRYWRQCRRRYFLHYIASRLGRRGCDDALCRRAFALDRRVTPRSFVRIVLCQTLHEAFSSSEHGSLVQRAVSRLRRDVNDMLLYGETAPLLVEGIDRGSGNVKELADRLAEEVRCAALRTEENFWNRIDLVPAYDRRPVDRPQRVKFMELDCYFVPVLALVRHGELWVLESNATDDDGELISCLHRMWAYNDLGRDPARVKSLYLDGEFQLRELDALPSVSASLEEIRLTISAMKEAEMEGFVTIADFPPTRGSVCAGCQFKTFCAEEKTT
ncbi:MAG: hypothetical protein IJS01_04840 [Lentisphaeria bacterium]|nr:hypothetical protein [Lentisphaeria bacterium]